MENVEVVVVRHDPQGDSPEGLEGQARVWGVIEGPPDARIRFGHDERTRDRVDIEEQPPDIGVAVGIKRGGRIAACIRRMAVEQNKLPEWGDEIPPCLPAVEGPRVATVVEPETTIIVARDQVGGVGGVDGEHLLGLEAKRTVLIHADVAITAGRQHLLTSLREEA